MARDNKKKVSNKKVEATQSSQVTGIKEESEKGELFFKIVLALMGAALFVVVVYFVVDALIGAGATVNNKRYNENNYVTTHQVNQIKGKENFENIDHDGLKNALDYYEYVYILFMAEVNTNGLTDSTKSRNDEALDVIDELFGLDVKKDVTLTVEDGKEYIFVTLGDNIAFFLVDTTDAGNSGWEDSIDTSEGNAHSADIPALLEIHNGDVLTWFGYVASVDSNKTTTMDKLNSLLIDLK